jgi:Tfp pilus assembly protein PilO
MMAINAANLEILRNNLIDMDKKLDQMELDFAAVAPDKRESMISAAIVASSEYHRLKDRIARFEKALG